MEDKKDEVTVLNTDIEEPQKEEDKQNNKEQNSQDNNDKKKTLKTVITTIICTLLFIIILLLLILLGLKKCARDNNGALPISSGGQDSSIKYDYDTDKMTDMFKYMINDKIDFDGYDGKAESIAVVTYIDNYDKEENNFKLNIVGYNDTKVYFYQITNAAYTGDKEQYDNFVSYLLLNDNYKTMTTGAAIDFSIMDKQVENVVSSKPNHKCIISKPPADIKYVSGYYLEEGKYYAFFQKELVDDVDPLASGQDMVIDNQDPLYTYYQKLNSVA